jgi:uncharacterized membrane protein YraQ (UPF0718 family)
VTVVIRRVQFYVPFIVGFVLTQALLGHVWSDTLWLTSFATFYVAILLEAVPFVLIGSLVSGAIEVFVPRETIARWVPRNRYGAVLLFGLLGVSFPVCECGIVPVIRRLLRKGVPLSCAITYLLAAPIVQPIVFLSTVVAFGASWKIGALRVLGGYLVAVTVGALSVGILDPHAEKALAFPVGSDQGEADGGEVCSCGEGGARSLRAEGRHVLMHAADDFIATGNYLFFGAFLAAAMQTFISQDALARLGGGAVSGTLVMMAVAFSVSLCSTADAFVAAAFTQFSLAARMAFLVMGPMVDIKLVAMYHGFLSRKATVFVFGLAAALSFLYAMLLHAGRL